MIRPGRIHALGLLLLWLAVPGSGASDPGGEPVDDRNVHISLPSSISSTLSEDGRSVALSRTSGDLALTVAKGRILVERSEGDSLVIRSDSAGLVLELKRGAVPFLAETVSGAITLFLDRSAESKIELATSGEISVDFSIEIRYEYHEEPAKRGEIVLGNGGSRIQLRSRRGHIGVLEPSP